jgi:superfamily II DNA/RNA helicase
VETGRIIGRSDENSSLLGSRMNVKPWVVHRHTQPSETGPPKHVTFSSLDVSPPLLSALSKMAIHAPTEIQRTCIPQLLAGLLLGPGIFHYR